MSERRDERQRRNREAVRRYRERNLERVRAYQRARYAANREELRAKGNIYGREYRATGRHGITRTIRDWMYESQDRACAGCFTPTPDAALEIDHDHSCCPGRLSCGRCVRGLVCKRCNVRDVLTAVFAARFGVVA